MLCTALVVTPSVVLTCKVVKRVLSSQDKEASLAIRLQQSTSDTIALNPDYNSHPIAELIHHPTMDCHLHPTLTACLVIVNPFPCCLPQQVLWTCPLLICLPALQMICFFLTVQLHPAVSLTMN